MKIMSKIFAGQGGILVFCISLILAGISCGGFPFSRDEDRPNVILISVDTLRADHIHGYGYGRETTPALDELMRKGTSFSNAISQSPWTLPSHASLFTSLYPHTHGVTDNLLALDEKVPTLTTMLKREGYKIAGFSTSPNLSARHGFIKGFDVYACEEVRAPIVCDRALKWLASIGRENFFLFLHFYDVHTDYEPLPHYLSMFETSYNGNVDGKGSTLYRVRDGELSISEADVRHLIALYDAEIRQFDNTIGMFFQILEERDMLSKTIVIVTSDHGEEFAEHGGVLHGRTLYDELLRIPFIMAGPGIPAGKIRKEQVQLIDVMPTILDLCDAKTPKSVEGRSLLSLIEKEDNEWLEIAFAEADHKNAKHDIKRAVRTDRYKLYYDRYTGREELYDLVLDPGEKTDILESQPEVAESLRGRLRQWMATERGKPIRIELTEKEKERLRALGYLN